MNRNWPPGTQIFGYTDGMVTFWVFGPGAAYPAGDFYLTANTTPMPSIYSIRNLQRKGVPEILQHDRDLSVDIGL